MLQRARQKAWLWAWTIALATPLGLPVGAQVTSSIAGQAGAVDDGRDNAAGVYVRDSSMAMEKLALAQRMQRLKEWNKSADIYQEILEKYQDRVVPAPGGIDANNRIVQYTSVTEAVRQALCHWPAEGLDVYRARYETTAAALLNGGVGDEMERLHQVFSQYFVTDSAKIAGIRLMDIYFEQGDDAAVEQIGQRLLNWHPNLISERPMVLFRTALAAKLCGDGDVAQKYLAELKQKFPQAVGSVRGMDVNLADTLQQELARSGALVRGASSDSWMTIGGDNERSKISSSTVKPGARLYSIALTPVTWKQVGDPTARANILQQDKQQRNAGAAIGVMPAVDHGELYFQDNAALYAVDLDSGSPLPGWAQTYSGSGGVFRLNSGVEPTPTGQQLCVTLSDKFVLAVMGLPDRLAMLNGLGGPDDTQLVCLDRHSGRLIWSASTHRLPESQSALRDLQMGGAPLVVGDNVYIIGRGGKGQQFEDCYVLCFGLMDGKFRWASYIASANSDQPMINPEGLPIVSDAVSHIAYGSGRLFVITDLGAAASLDAYTGAVEWLNIYRDEAAVAPADAAPFMMRQAALAQLTNIPQPWTYNPAMVQNGKVFCLPSDSPYVFVYDGGTGREIKRIWLADYTVASDSDTSNNGAPTTPVRPNTLLAVDGDMLIFSGENRTWRIPWRAYDHSNDDSQKPSGYWQSAPFSGDFGGQHSEDEHVRGRGFVTADAVYVPTDKALRRVLLRNGMVDRNNGTFPRNGWDATDEGPGNVVMTQDHVIVAGDRHVAVYTDIAMARAKLDREVAQNPTDPGPRLHYAEVMFVAGEIHAAEDRLEQAFELLGGVKSPTPGADSDRAFTDSMNFASKLAQRNAPEDEVNRLYDLAAASAQNPVEQVNYRVARAKYDVSENDLPAAVALYQQVLAEPALRQVALPDSEGGGSKRAGAVVEKAIDAILQSPQGRKAYEPFEQAAAAKMDAARAAHDMAALLEIARAYPNTKQAGESMMAAAEVEEAKGDYRSAAHILRDLYNRHGSGRARVLEALARNELRLPGRLDVAASRLALAAVEAPDAKLSQPLQLPDGSVVRDVTLAAARAIVSQYSARSSLELLPDLRLPTAAQINAYEQRTHRYPADPFLAESPQTTIGNVSAMIVPDQEVARGDRIVAYSEGNGVAIYAPGASTPICRCAAVKKQPLGAAWTDGLLVVWTGDAVYGIDPTSGAAKWQVQTGNLAEMDPIAPPTSGAENQQPNAPAMPAWQQQIAQQQQIQLQQAGGMQPPPPSDAGGPERIDRIDTISDRAIACTSTGRVLAVDLADGRIAWQVRVGTHPLDGLLASDDFTVARFRDDQGAQLVVLRSFSGEVLGRRAFSFDSPATLVNAALAADGTLVYTLSDRLCIQDLNDLGPDGQGMEPKFTTDITPETAQMFNGEYQPGQLVIHDGRVYALSDQGKLVRAYSLDTGKPWRFQTGSDAGEAGSNVNGILNSGSSGNANVTMHISGNYMFVLGPRTLLDYRLDKPESPTNTPLPMPGATNYEQLLIGRDYAVAVARQRPPLSVSNAAGTRATLYAFTRAAAPGKPDSESGQLRFSHAVTDLSADAVWQPLQGGIAYFSNGAIHQLLGARDALDRDVNHPAGN